MNACCLHSGHFASFIDSFKKVRCCFTTIIHLYCERRFVILLRCLISLRDTRWPLVLYMLWPLTVLSYCSQRQRDVRRY